MSSLRFLEGACSERQGDGNFSSAIEYRDSLYASAPNNPYLETVDRVNFATDSFYASTPTLRDDDSNISCSATADVVIKLDMENEAMRSVASECEGDRIDGSIDFCRSTDLQTAQDNFRSVCSNPS